ncbi:hypothetical protein V1477_010043, partial [Vespula maculifrons]
MTLLSPVSLAFQGKIYKVCHTLQLDPGNEKLFDWLLHSIGCNSDVHQASRKRKEEEMKKKKEEEEEEDEDRRSLGWCTEGRRKGSRKNFRTKENG